MSNPFHLEPYVRLVEKADSNPLQLPASRDHWDEWSAGVRKTLRQHLGISGDSNPPVSASEIKQRIRDDLIETKWSLQAEGRAPVPVYELTSKPAQSANRAVIVFHGHNPSVQYCLGNYPDEETAKRLRARDNDYAENLARAGWRVFAVEQQGFGERQSASPGGLTEGVVHSSCRDLAFRYMTVGKTVLGERVRDAQTVVDWLLEQNVEVAVAGNSGGGTTSMYAAALDSRIRVAACGSTFSSFEASIHGPFHCPCNYVPRIRTFADMGEIASLIAPRPLCFLQGERDPIFPSGPAREQFKKVQKAYALHGVDDDRARLRFHPGEHAWNHQIARDFLSAWFPPRGL